MCSYPVWQSHKTVSCCVHKRTNTDWRRIAPWELRRHQRVRVRVVQEVMVQGSLQRSETRSQTERSLQSPLRQPGPGGRG